MSSKEVTALTAEELAMFVGAIDRQALFRYDDIRRLVATIAARDDAIRALAEELAWWRSDGTVEGVGSIGSKRCVCCGRIAFHNDKLFHDDKCRLVATAANPLATAAIDTARGGKEGGDAE